MTQGTTAPTVDNLNCYPKVMMLNNASRIKTELLEYGHLIKEGKTIRDKLITTLYGLSAGMRWFKKRRSIEYARNYWRPVTLKNADGIFYCGRSFSVSRILSSFYERKMNGYFKMTDGVFVDIGAHAGKYTIKMAHRLKKTGTVVAIEPEEFNFYLLIKNVALNSLENVICINKACSDKDGITTFFKHDKYSTLHSIKINKGGQAQQIETRKLDTIVSDMNLDAVKLIKIDVEGAELEVIKGARSTIRKFHPEIIFEAWNRAYLSKIRDELSTSGYVLSNIKEGCYLAKKDQ